MRVKLKTLKNVVVDLDLPTDTSVQKIKEAGAASEHGKAEGWDPEGMKLIYQGKIMDNAKDMASYNVQEDDFMVVMAAKPKKPAASEAAPAAAAPTAYSDGLWHLRGPHQAARELLVLLDHLQVFSS